MQGVDKKAAKRTTAIDKTSKGFTDEERGAMRERAQELKVEARADKDADGESAVLAKIAEMPEPDRALGERLHAIIKASAPALSPKTWYGMPAYAKDGKVVCFFKCAQKFNTRYATLGFSDAANLDDRRHVAGRLRAEGVDRRRRGKDRRAREASGELRTRRRAWFTGRDGRTQGRRPRVGIAYPPCTHPILQRGLSGSQPINQGGIVAPTVRHWTRFGRQFRTSPPVTFPFLPLRVDSQEHPTPHAARNLFICTAHHRDTVATGEDRRLGAAAGVKGISAPCRPSRSIPLGTPSCRVVIYMNNSS